MQRRLFALEAILLALPALSFLAATLPEAWRITVLYLRLRASSNPEISVQQALSGLAYWLAGATTLSVLGLLVVATVRKQTFSFGAFFWLAAVAGAALALSMLAPFGAPLTAAIAVPLAVLTAHSAHLQLQDRKASQAQSAA